MVSNEAKAKALKLVRDQQAQRVHDKKQHHKCPLCGNRISEFAFWAYLTIGDKYLILHPECVERLVNENPLVFKS